MNELVDSQRKSLEHIRECVRLAADRRTTLEINSERHQLKLDGIESNMEVLNLELLKQMSDECDVKNLMKGAFQEQRDYEKFLRCSKIGLIDKKCQVQEVENAEDIPKPHKMRKLILESQELEEAADLCLHSNLDKKGETFERVGRGGTT